MLINLIWYDPSLFCFMFKSDHLDTHDTYRLEQIHYRAHVLYRLICCYSNELLCNALKFKE